MEIEALVLLLAGLMIVRQSMFFSKRRGVTQVNVLSDRFWEQAFRKTVIYLYALTGFAWCLAT